VRVGKRLTLLEAHSVAAMVVFNVRENHGQVLLEMVDQLRQAAAGASAITVRILASNDHDGVCATKILVTVLNNKGVKYTVVPVAGNVEIVEHLQQLEEDAEVRSLVLLNCGASLPLQQQMLECATPLNLKCYVIDSHRPFLLDNLSIKSDRVFVYDDDPKLDDPEGPNMRPPVDETDEEEEGMESEPELGDAEGEEHALEPQQAAAERLERQRKRLELRRARAEAKRHRINAHYLSSYCATPSAVSLFRMARQAAPLSQDLLWVAAVSLVGYHEQGSIGKLEYERLAYEELFEHFDRTDITGSISSSLQSKEDSTGFGSDDESSMPRKRIRPSSTKQKLRFEPDFRLLLYKHWTLEESMMHSAYFYGTLELHRDKGLRALKNFFVTAGIRPSAYKQLYSCMSYPIRKNIQSKFSDFGKGYGLAQDKMFLQQFVRDLGPLGASNHALWSQEISSSDAAHIVISLLSYVPQNLSVARAAYLPQLEGGRRDTAAVTEMERQAMRDNFWRAFDMILCKDPAPLRDGMEEAMGIAKSVQALGRFIKDTKAMHTDRLFRWCKIEQPPHPFRHNLTVRRLAVWLLQVLFTYGPNTTNAPELPILVMVRDHVRETYLCIGATPSRLSDDKDEFGYLFRKVLRADKSLKVRYDFFDKSCIEIAAGDFERFWLLLTS